MASLAQNPETLRPRSLPLIVTFSGGDLLGVAEGLLAVHFCRGSPLSLPNFIFFSAHQLVENAVAEAPVIVAVAVKLDVALWRAMFIYNNFRTLSTSAAAVRGHGRGRFRAKRIDNESEQ